MLSAESKCSRWFRVGAGVLVFLSFAVLAEPAKDAKAEPAKDAKEDPVEIFARAEQAMNRQDLKESLELLRKAAELNHTPAQVFFAEYLDYSEFNEDAVGWFMMAAFQGNPQGAFGLAKLYALGEGVEKSNEKALYWFRFAAERNHLGAVQMMAATYKNGLLAQKVDLDQAKLWADKVPALEAAEKKELERKIRAAKIANEEAAKKAKEDQEAKNKKFLEEKALAEEAAKKATNEAPAGEAVQGPSK